MAYHGATGGHRWRTQDVRSLTFAPFSTGAELATPRFFRHAEQALARAPRRLATVEQGTPHRAARRTVVARVYERRAGRRRGDFAHQHRRRLVNAVDLIAGEDRSVNRMVRNQCLAKSIPAAAWSQFADLLAYKAAGAGRTCVAVTPASTSQDCSQCGHGQVLSLSDRLSTCPCGGVVLDRDLNASLNSLSVGQHALASA
ncbi:MAG TPA: RNA-guided endonuclease TnpB family protein [Ktedonobacterales bacterium]|nr:RNA-guided endonuclease TnpB family protein [Ktedonobacterales bacterium]